MWHNPTFTAEGSFAAVVGGEAVSIALLSSRLSSGRGFNAFAATRPEYRGRGLALAAKAASLRWAAANGITRVSTANDSENAPMLAINRRLGYRPLGRLVTLRRVDVSGNGRFASAASTCAVTQTGVAAYRAE